MNIYNLSRAFWDFSFENPGILKPNHIKAGIIEDFIGGGMQIKDIAIKYNVCFGSVSDIISRNYFKKKPEYPIVLTLKSKV
jgi:Mor family transcriptional regulator